LKQYRRGLESNPFVQFLARVEPIRAALPSSGTIGYLARPAADCEVTLAANRFGLLVYALTPCWLDRSADGPSIHEYCLFDADDPQAVPPQARELGWTVIADAGNGLKLYRTAASSTGGTAR
jgi:hypothetical protein